MSTDTDLHRQARAWYRHLRQHSTWIPANGQALPITAMDNSWRRNAANWLLKRADALAAMYSYAELHLDSEPIGRDIDGDPVFMRMPHEVESGLFDEHRARIADASSWLKTMPLYRALIRGLADGGAKTPEATR